MKSAKIFFLSVMLISLAAVGTVFGDDLAGDYPSYQDGILTIPRVDTSGQAGTFQDVKIQLTEQGDWRLTDFKAVGRVVGTSVLIRPIADTVETIVTDTFPVQVFLKVKGVFTNGCTEMGKIPQRLKDNRFEVVMYAERHNPEDTCTANVVDFEKIIPLSVYGLSAGTYEYSLSGVRIFGTAGEGTLPKTFTGTFSLAKDNKF